MPLYSKIEGVHREVVEMKNLKDGVYYNGAELYSVVSGVNREVFRENPESDEPPMI